MKPITRDEIVSAEEYETMRPEFRRRVMVKKRKRRVAVGAHAMFHFETRDTMMYQVLEMLRVEGSWERPGAIEDELEAYNPLIPRGGNLSATLMLEYETVEERTVWLQQLVGLPNHVWLHIEGQDRIRAQFDESQVAIERISSVQYLSWELNEAQRKLIREEGTAVRLLIDHDDYRAQSVLSEETRREIAGDLE